jgi:hypothetical protein
MANFVNIGLSERQYSHVVRTVHQLSIDTGENVTMSGLFKKIFFEKYPLIIEEITPQEKIYQYTGEENANIQ